MTPVLLRLDRVTKALLRPDGLDLHTGSAVLRITALTAGILRVRVAPDGAFPRDESWAVLPAMQRRSVEVAHAPSGDGLLRFATTELTVTTGLDPLHLTITDSTGHVLLDDAPARPVTFTGASFRVWKTSPSGEHYYGLGDKPGRLDRRGRVFRMWNTDDLGWSESSDLLYKSIPFLIGVRDGRAWGMLLDNTWRSVFDLGVSAPDTIAFGADGGLLDFYVLAGPDPKTVLRRYATLTGPAPLPPLWTLGFHQSRYSYPSQARVLEVAAKHRMRGIPLDAIWLDIEYQHRNRPFTVDTDSFPDLSGMTRRLDETGIRTIAITDLHIARQPDAGYQPYDTGLAGDHFLRNADGSLFIGESWPGSSVFPDFAQARTRAWWGDLYRDFYLQHGIAGFWNDMNEPSVRDGPGHTMLLDVQHRVQEPGQPERTVPHAEMHNAYGQQNIRATHEGLLRLDATRRPFVLTRASFAGGHRYAATWIGDNASTWQDLRLSVPQLLNLGLSGFALSGGDVGSFLGSPSADLLTRWVQLGAFTPFFRNHTALGTADQEAWVHGPDHEAIRRRAIEARYRLLPYLYTLADETSRTGTPMMRPMVLEFPAAGLETEEIQFMLGNALLVAPWPDETLGPYPLRLPMGTAWYDYWTGRRLDASDDIKLEKRLDHLAVFARAGSIVPHQPLVQSTAQVPDGPLLLHVYPGPDCSGAIYQDDGVSFACRQQGFLRQQFACTTEAAGYRLHLGPREGAWEPWWHGIEVLLHGADKPARRIDAARGRVDEASYDEAQGLIRFRIDTDAAGSDVHIETE